MKTAYIAHPIGGDVAGNVKKVLAICLEVHRSGVIPIVPYLGALQYLDDTIPDDRRLGMEANLECLRRGMADEVWLYGDKISTGMEIELRSARIRGIPVLAKTEATALALGQMFP